MRQRLLLPDEREGGVQGGDRQLLAKLVLGPAGSHRERGVKNILWDGRRSDSRESFLPCLRIVVHEGGQGLVQPGVRDVLRPRFEGVIGEGGTKDGGEVRGGEEKGLGSFFSEVGEVVRSLEDGEVGAREAEEGLRNT